VRGQERASQASLVNRASAVYNAFMKRVFWNGISEFDVASSENKTGQEGNNMGAEMSGFCSQNRSHCNGRMDLQTGMAVGAAFWPLNVSRDR
jgi:hypothetical protein